ncbi:GNAT family N-acetyltransferase [Clostridium sp. D33t1_170424_F3]|uniref:GNAT family N-acetyltransferase n=1 Tax=Clostridium sp. D33t1_170424_F3 TaxID=2787099 RepID=UPI0018A8B64D|nr:GNAT family N-acetyltransferase [Clostridium sp. D33t1_170424_F3]
MEETFCVQEAGPGDLYDLLHLYTHLHDSAPSGTDAQAAPLWEQICADPSYHILIVRLDGRIVSSCTLVVIPNLTRGQRPYALIENVVTHGEYRGRGLASLCLRRAEALARQAGCYKLMLLTGSREESTLRFYERAGFNRNDKTAFIQWL